ncbi:MAG: GNAT family N-acetyltransferase [Flavobacteriales bacterium]|nr:GNAT family N-acetyltransferase [Flavobacteriales bacterium]
MKKRRKNNLSGSKRKSNAGGPFAPQTTQDFLDAGGLNDIDLSAKKAEIGLGLLPSYLGQGVMQEALSLITEFGIRSLHRHRIEGFVESENLKCKYAMSKLDFQLESTIKESEVKDGKAISVDVDG